MYKHIPKELIERPKAGFAIPIGEWIKGPLREWADDLLDKDALKNDGYFDPEKVSNMWSRHLKGEYGFTPRLWAILMFQTWKKDL